MHSGSPAQARCGSEARPKSLILHLRTPGGSSRSSCGETAGECGPHRRQASKIFSSRFSRRHRVTRGPGARGLRRWRAARLRSPAMGSYRLRPCQQRRRCASLRASAHPAHPCTPLHTPAHPCTPLHTPAHPCTPLHTRTPLAGGSGRVRRVDAAEEHSGASAPRRLRLPSCKSKC
jgi:hypothetical protein